MTKQIVIVLFLFILSNFLYFTIGLDLGLNRLFVCDRQRTIFTSRQGVISNGNEYHKDSHCEWLIKAPDDFFSITLTFTKMDTECSYDHVFIYDGESYSSPLLGSFSGNTTPPSVTTTHGAMLVLLYSDTNYVRSGFEAVFHVTECPLNCSNNGICRNHKCLCQPLWSGDACDISLCPNDCGNFAGHGECDLNGSYPIHCKCKPGYSGMDCSLPDSNKNSGNTWHILSVSGMSPRAGHIGIYIQRTDSFYVYGGYTFQKVLGDTLVYSFESSQWRTVETIASPYPRFGHAAISFLGNIIVFGGEFENGSLSNELWLFNVSSSTWMILDHESNFIPPPLTKHSATLVDSYWLYIIGGTLSDNTLSSKVYRINLHLKKWEIVETYGSKHSNLRLIGHSAVYYEPIKTIFVFGGITAEYSHVSKLSNVMHAFHVDKRYWVKIEYQRNVYNPMERAFHSAAIVGHYMVIFGGYTHKHVEEEICYDNDTHFYHLLCHKWVDFSTLKADFVGIKNPVSQGVFSHTMGVRRGHTLLVAGGYSGFMRSQFLAYVIPSAIISDQPSLNSCYRHKQMESCLSNLACGWCFENEKCIERKDSKSCSKFSAETCPGFCSALSDCLSCLLWSQSLIQNDISDRQEQHFPPVLCAWCVQDSKCHAINDGDTSCSSGNATAAVHGSGSQSNGWWGTKGTDILSLNECYIKDTPPGLISVHYRYPVNWSQPDEVTYLLQASEDLFFRSEIQRNESNGIEENVVKFIGFLHPLNAKPLSERIKTLKLAICSAGSSATLKLSNDSTLVHLEHVASHGPRTSFDCLEAKRNRGAALFPHSGGGEKYMFEFTVKIPTSYNDTSKVQLKWTAFSVELEVIQHKYLELYKNGTCHSLSNCLSCLTDSLCGWCDSTETCHLKSDFSIVCQNADGNSFLVTQPNSCTVCSDYIYCEHCTQIPTCEWLVEAAICVRKGRYKIAAKEPKFCPVPCHLRMNCSSCLGEPGVCAWCEETATCFPFSVYTSTYSYGKCRDWVDENRAENGDISRLCRNCTRHANCSSCLKDLTCGWCSYAKHPQEGLCVDGDFSGPYSGMCPAFVKNETELSDSQWLYGSCPDLDECYLKLHNCHTNATCRNTPQSYVCECNLGFEGDGRNCVRACAVKCVHGYCSEAPDYRCICNLGWTGEDCSENCGCNNHSTCERGIGVCDECQNWTEGEFCEKCRVGSYGYTHDSKGCKKCNCNRHGDPEKGFCDRTTGTCFCLNNTMGENCEKCISGYYGNPRKNGNCYEVCSSRKVITNATGGKFGSPVGNYQSQDCLWLLTVHSVLDMKSLLGPMESTDFYLQLTVNQDLHVPCPHNHIYVYDGLPNFVASGHPNVLLGAYCGSNVSEHIVATAASGYLTVHFKRDFFNYGFNASYIRLKKEPSSENAEYCLENTTLDENVTVCLRNYCPRDCFRFYNQGYCDKAYRICICEKGFSGVDCSIKVQSHNLVWDLIYDFKSVDMNESALNVPSDRMGHSLLSIRDQKTDTDNLWLFGGYSLIFGDLDDLYFYNTSSHKWTEVITDNTPSPRHFHAAASVNSSLYIFGGLNDTYVLGDFWEFNVADQIWTVLPGILTTSGTMNLTGCTLTVINEQKLLLIGGYSPSYGLLEKVMEYDIESQQWLALNSTGAFPIGVYGHTSVYHEATESIYIFGGILYDTETVSSSNGLYSYHYPSGQWFRLPPDSKVNSFKTKPPPKYFHAAVMTENYMILIGGRGTRGLKDLRPFAYVFSCNLWIPLKDAAIQVVGNWPDPIVGAAMTIANGDIYLYGGSEGQLHKFSLPDDLCHLFTTNRVGCIQQTGCAFCSFTENGQNQTICYAQHRHAESRCYNPTESKQFFTTTCDAEWLEKRDCHQYRSCSDCVASWPQYPEAKQLCRWCSNCRVGTCAPITAKCSEQNECSMQKDIIRDPTMCPMRECAASDCQKCGELGKCIWTRQVFRSGGYSHTLNKNPIYNWVCIMKEIMNAPSFPIESMPPSPCPKGCELFKDCTSCLKSPGGEGGWHQCVWSEPKKLCMSPTFELLRCEDSSCGPVIYGNASICPVPCWQHFQAANCISQASCGWCAFSGPRVDGRGLCMNGGIMGPTGGICREGQVVLFGQPLPDQTVVWYQRSEGSPTWNYLTKPPENECKNNHHNCDDAHEECVDTLEAFECRCKPGYKMIGKHCTPTCRQGCVNGTCVQPDICQCHFGFVGQNCSIMCKCHGHSNCPSASKLDMCIECHNNTMGAHCEHCKPLFVGNPANSGKCISCQDYCFAHSSVCVSFDLVNSTYSQVQNQTLVNELVEKMTEGPLDDAVCIDCKNNTEGKRCDQCILGYFKVGEGIEDGCRPCECHGHGDVCNPLNGENCNCQNNTENDRVCSQKNMKNVMHITPCWQLQCSKCKEYFLGSPSHGHQCYRHMFLDKDYCFNPGTIEECNRNPSPLLVGRTGFFAVQPRYMNVDIRIIVDVTKGGVDFFLSAKDDAFIVEVDKETGLHHIYIDEKYGLDMKGYDISDIQFSVKTKRSLDEFSKDSYNSSDGINVETLFPTISNAQGLTTYIEVKQCGDFLLVKNLKNRLVVTVPQEVHDLRTTRFYIILRGSEEETFGNLFFRQDQTRIDLFVFFSVFFSCFFLFLAICVVMWKVKQAFDVRRQRRLHAAEMKHMASRPFGRIITVVDEESDIDFLLYSPSYHKKLKNSKVQGRDSPKIEEKPRSVIRPLAIEPLSDGFGAIATILVQLPGGAKSLVRMSLASSLITARSSPYHLGFNLRAAMRRRASHANV